MADKPVRVERNGTVWDVVRGDEVLGSYWTEDEAIDKARRYGGGKRKEPDSMDNCVVMLISLCALALLPAVFVQVARRRR